MGNCALRRLEKEKVKGNFRATTYLLHVFCTKDNLHKEQIQN